MAANTNIIKIYADADSEQKVDIICRYYPNFIGMIDGYTEGLRYVIENEKNSSRRAAMGDLGVRVQSIGHYSDPTANTATNNVDIVRAIKDCDFSDGVLDDVSSKDEIQRKALILKSMRKDFNLFNSQLGALNPNEKRFFEMYLRDRRKLMDLAEETGIQYESAGQKCRRLKERIKIIMTAFIDGEI